MAMKVHPAADLFPMLVGVELDRLAESIRINGQIHPVLTWRHPTDGLMLIDGRNRVAACEQIGIQARSEEFVGSEKSALDRIVVENLKRRQLKPSQVAMLGPALLPMYEAAAKRAQEAARQRSAETVIRRSANGGSKPEGLRESSLMPSGGQPPGGNRGRQRGPQSRDDVAAALGVTPDYVSNAKAVEKKGIPELGQAVRDGEINVRAASGIARLPKEEQLSALSKHKGKARNEEPSEKHNRPPRNPSSGSVDKGCAALLIATRSMVRPSQCPQIVLLRCETLKLFETALPEMLTWGYHIRGILTWDRGPELGPEYWPILSQRNYPIDRKAMPIAPVAWRYRDGEVPTPHLGLLDQLQTNGDGNGKN